MNSKNSIKTIFFLAAIVLVVFLGWIFVRRENGSQVSSLKQAFLQDKLKTNTSIASIPLEKILDGGPGKDGIPALINPTFVSTLIAKGFLSDDVAGILIVRENTAKFYPYTILVWHEIVNDVINDEVVVVTFCPLCASALVFDANVNGKKETFGVSGKLYESNLLMYDYETESLWSQIVGEAVVGEKTGKKLTHVPFRIVTFGEVLSNFPNAQVLSINTGYDRDYTFYPYGNYNENEDIYFRISIKDTRLPLKEPMYIIDVQDSSIAFKVLDLKEGVVARVNVGNKNITVESKNGEIVAQRSDGTVIPGYYAAWFSWAIHHQEDGIVWTGG